MQKLIVYAVDSMSPEIFVSLANGGTLVMVSQSAREDAARVANIMRAGNITYTTFITSEYLDLLRYGFKVLSKCKSWHFAIVSRDKVTARLRRAMRGLELPGLELVSVYGPVEASISCSRVRLDY